MMGKTIKNANNNMKLKVSSTLFALLLAPFLLTACSGDGGTQSLKKYTNEVKQRKGEALSPIPKVKPYEKYAYPEHFRNPFRPIPNPRQGGKGRGPDHDRPKQALEIFPFDALRMVGTLHEDSDNWAVIAAPDGAVYRVMVGNYMGQNFGKVTEITPKSVEVMEMVQVGDSWEKRPATLALTKEQEK